MMTRKRWGVLFGTPVAVIAVLDVHAALSSDVTLSQTIRETFRVHTPAGRAALLGSFVALNAVLVPHLLKVAGEIVAENVIEELS